MPRWVTAQLVVELHGSLMSLAASKHENQDGDALTASTAFCVAVYFIQQSPGAQVRRFFTAMASGEPRGRTETHGHCLTL